MINVAISQHFSLNLFLGWKYVVQLQSEGYPMLYLPLKFCQDSFICGEVTGHNSTHCKPWDYNEL